MLSAKKAEQRHNPTLKGLATFDRLAYFPGVPPASLVVAMPYTGSLAIFP
jgi:hypothetical protein